MSNGYPHTQGVIPCAREGYAVAVYFTLKVNLSMIEERTIYIKDKKIQCQLRTAYFGTANELLVCA